MKIILIAIGVVLLTISIIFFIKSYKIKQSAEQVLHQAECIKIQKANQEEERLLLKKEIQGLICQKDSLLQQVTIKKLQTDKIYQIEKNRLEEQIAIYKKGVDQAANAYIDGLQNHYVQAENKYLEKIASARENYQKQIQSLELQTQEVTTKLNKLKEKLSAGMQAQLREQEKQQNLKFYKLHLTEEELSDIKLLEDIKKKLNQPVILSKLIWSSYFLKQTNELCNRVLGKNVVCGIYKITNLQTKQVYIGQSVNVAQRWKQHIKCGLGIDASATNKLYNAMISYGVWNFTFELMESCSRDALNEKESYWINMYQSDKYGLNTSKGNK